MGKCHCPQGRVDLCPLHTFLHCCYLSKHHVVNLPLHSLEVPWGTNNQVKVPLMASGPVECPSFTLDVQESTFEDYIHIQTLDLTIQGYPDCPGLFQDVYHHQLCVSKCPCTSGIPRQSRTIPGCPSLPTPVSEYPHMPGIPRLSRSIPGCPQPPTACV